MTMSIVMQCADEELKERVFRPLDTPEAHAAFERSIGRRVPPEYVCTHCGWIQTSTAAGCAELCVAGGWHSRQAYYKYRDIARAGGYDVPDEPINFQPDPTDEANVESAVALIFIVLDLSA